MASNEDDGNAYAGVCQLSLKLQAADSRKGHIQNKTTRPIRFLVTQKLFRRLKGFGP